MYYPEAQTVGHQAASLVFQLADIAVISSMLREHIPLDQFRSEMDIRILEQIKERFVQENLTAKVKQSLQGGAGGVDLVTVMHYMVLTSTQEQFGINFQELDVYHIIAAFSSCEQDFNIPIGRFENYGLDHQIIYDLVCFQFVQRYRQVFRYKFADSYQNALKAEQARLCSRIMSSRQRFYNFLDQIQQCMLGPFDEVMSGHGVDALRSLDQIGQLVQLTGLLLDTVRECKSMFGQDVRIDLQQILGVLMYFMVEITKLAQYCVNMPTMAAIYEQVIENLVSSLDDMYMINRQVLWPINMAEITPVSSPQGRLVTYSSGLVQCMLDSLYNVIQCSQGENSQEISLLTNSLRRIITSQGGDGNHIRGLMRSQEGKQIQQRLVQLGYITLEKYKQLKNAFIVQCNMIMDIIISFTEIRLYVSFRPILDLLVRFTFGQEGTTQIKQKCCYVIGKLRQKDTLEQYFNEHLVRAQYTPGTDRMVDQLFRGDGRQDPM